MDIKQWMVEHWSDILAWVLAFIAYFLFFVNTLKVGKTRTVLSIQFRDKSAHIDKRSAELKQLGQAMLAEAKILSENAARIVEEERERMAQTVAEMREYTEQAIVDLKRNHAAEIQKYKESLLEISQNEKTLVAKGVSEKIARRFSDEQNASASNDTEALKPIEEVQIDGYDKQ